MLPSPGEPTELGVMRAPPAAPAYPHRVGVTRLVARGAMRLDLLHHLTEVVGRWSLQRRELLVRQQMLEPQLLTDGQHVPVVLEGRHRTAERTAQAHRRLLVCADVLLEG